MAHVEIYTKATCPFCLRAKALLTAKGLGLMRTLSMQTRKSARR